MTNVQDFYEERVYSPELSADTILNSLMRREGATLLDFGCYDGVKTIMYRDRIGAARVIGVDVSQTKLALAQALGIETICADFNTDFPLKALPPESVDVITCSEVIEHVYSPDDLLDEISRLLKPDGYLLLTTPNLASWKNRFLLLLGLQPFLTEVSTRKLVGNPFRETGIPVGHIRMFTLPALLELAGQSGLRPISIRGLSLPSPSRTLLGALSRLGDQLLALIPALADRFVIRFEKNSVQANADR